MNIFGVFIRLQIKHLKYSHIRCAHVISTVIRGRYENDNRKFRTNTFFLEAFWTGFFSFVREECNSLYIGLVNPSHEEKRNQFLKIQQANNKKWKMSTSNVIVINSTGLWVSFWLLRFFALRSFFQLVFSEQWLNELFKSFSIPPFSLFRALAVSSIKYVLALFQSFYILKFNLKTCRGANLLKINIILSSKFTLQREDK